MAYGHLLSLLLKKVNKVAVISYGIGNLKSICNALSFIGADPVLVSNPADLGDYKRIILPGVGSFRLAMELLHATGFFSSILEYVEKPDNRIFGICLGFQMLGLSSTEGGLTDGLKLIPGITERFNTSTLSPVKTPHIGFNTVKIPEHVPLFKNLSIASDFYFVHSYRMNILDPSLTAYCTHGETFSAAYQNNNIYGSQFHPEKSQTNGLILLSNFIYN